MITTLSIEQHKALKKQAHHLNPKVIIGSAGLSPAVEQEIDKQLNCNGLIKIKALVDEKEQRVALLEVICEKMSAHAVGQIGKMLIIFREMPKLEAAKVYQNQGLREVTVVKRSKNRRRPPSRRTLLLKGNERLTAGGKVKRVRNPKSSRRNNTAC